MFFFQDEEINLYNKKKAAAQAAQAQAQQAGAQVAKEQMKGKKKWTAKHTENINKLLIIVKWYRETTIVVETKDFLSDNYYLVLLIF